MTSIATFAIPERVSVAGDNALMPFLLQNTDRSLQIDAGLLRRLDTPLVQTLLAASADRRMRGLDFRITNLSPDHADQLGALGVTAEMLPIEVQQ